MIEPNMGTESFFEETQTTRLNSRSTLNKRHRPNFGFWYRTIVASVILLFAPLFAGCEDWSVALIDSTTAQFPDPAKLGEWDYPHSLYLYGVYQTYKRTGDRRYFDYMQKWADSHISKDGHIDHDLEALDDWLGGNLLVTLWSETHHSRYRKAALEIRQRINTYPRLPDGSLWHAVKWRDQVWADGLYMSMPFLVRYGDAFNDQTYTRAEATRQLTLSESHLRDPKTGLYYHAYDETGQSEWADPVTHRSRCFWGRAIGWYSMALVDVLDHLPEGSEQHKQVLHQFRELINALIRYQDPGSGLWYEVVDRKDLADNWLETSSSSMYVYALFKGMEHHYLGPGFSGSAEKGYRGVLSRITRRKDGSVRLSDICEGTNVGDLDFYLHRARNTNDLHGIGAFLLMNEAVLAYRANATSGHAATAHASLSREAKAGRASSTTP